MTETEPHLQREPAIHYFVMGYCYQADSEYDWEFVEYCDSFEDAEKMLKEAKEEDENGWYKNLRIECQVTTVMYQE